MRTYFYVDALLVHVTYTGNPEKLKRKYINALAKHLRGFPIDTHSLPASLFHVIKQLQLSGFKNLIKINDELEELITYTIED